MRFDDMIATVLAQPPRDARQLAAQWRQLVDLLAQGRHNCDSAQAARAFHFLRSVRAHVSAEDRIAAAHSLAGLPIAPALLLFFAEDRPAVASPLIASARLDGAEWLRVLPRLSPSARALLRHRRDLPAAVLQALEAFGASDMVLENKNRAPAPDEAEAEAKPVAEAEAEAETEPLPSQAAGPAAERSESQIRELVARIEAYRKEREIASPPTASAPLRTAPAPVSPGASPAAEFRWETGADGVIMWVEGVPRGPLIGQSIAAMAERGQPGVDGQAAGAFEKRAPFRDARLNVAGKGPASGGWRISGVPFFDSRRGSFLGYRGSARRPRIDEVAHASEEVETGLFGTDIPADSLRQLVHEVRTPLNAIIGFAELIEGQHMGPAAAGYRSRAAGITDQARRLLSAVDDLDTAARIEAHGLDLAESAVDAVALLCRLHDSYEKVARQRGARLAMEIETGLPAARLEPGAAERMFARLLAATIGLAGDGETISAVMKAQFRGGEDMLCLSVGRPRAIAGIAESSLLDPGYSPDGDWPGAPVLGLGFALRLVRNLAEASGGALEVGETRFSLCLPAAGSKERVEGVSGNGA